MIDSFAPAAKHPASASRHGFRKGTDVAVADMSWEIAFDGKDVAVTAHGRATVPGLQEMTAAWLADPRFAQDSAVILDYRDLDWGSMSVADLRTHEASPPTERRLLKYASRSSRTEQWNAGSSA